MADSFYAIDKTKSQGNELVNILNRLGVDFAVLKFIRLAMIQQRDGDGTDDSHYATLVTNFGYTTTAEAHASFSEIDSFISNGGPSLEQCCARHKQ